MNMLDGKTFPTEATHCCKSPGCKSMDHTRSCKYFNLSVENKSTRKTLKRLGGMDSQSPAGAWLLSWASYLVP